MFDKSTRAGFQRRIGNLTPNAERRWGRMTAHQMVCHLTDQLRVAFGEIPTQPIRGVLRYPLMKQFVIDVMPWPKGRVQAASEMFSTPPGVWQHDLTTLSQMLERFLTADPRSEWPPHPQFGRMSGPLWGRLVCRHFDHHLSQFGC